jgi:hypothetical protein
MINEYIQSNLTLEVIFVGVDKDFITPSKAVDISFKTPNVFGSDVLLDLELSKSSKVEFCNCLLKYILREEISFDIKTKKYLETLQKWHLFFLLEIYNKQSSITHKLNDIENLWSFLDYPTEWESFIYYLPSRTSNSEESLYDNFCKYLFTSICKTKIKI